MPRKKPVSEIDLAIGRRLGELRLDREFSREELADRAQVSAGVITRVELGYMPLRYFDARRLLRGLAIGSAASSDLRPVNPLWLARGSGTAEVGWPLILPANHHLGIPEAASFSTVIEANHNLISTLVDDPLHAQLPESWLAAYLEHWDALRQKAFELEDGAEAVKRLFLTSAEKLADQSPRASALLLDYHAALNAAQLTRPWECEKKTLTNIPRSEKLFPVRIEMDSLLAQARELAAPRGSRTQLATALGVSTSRITEWLAGDSEPDGRHTLLLFNWVEEKKASQQQTPDRASTRPGAKTHPPKSKHENEKQDQWH